MSQLNPQQIKFLEYYLDIKSETFGNALQSALKAGYAQEYAETITAQMPKWLSENLGDAKMLLKAERNLNELLDEDDKRVRADITKFVAERLGKRKYSVKSPLLDDAGKPIPIYGGVSRHNSDQENISTEEKD